MNYRYNLLDVLKRDWIRQYRMLMKIDNAHDYDSDDEVYQKNFDQLHKNFNIFDNEVCDTLGINTIDWACEAECVDDKYLIRYDIIDHM